MYSKPYEGASVPPKAKDVMMLRCAMVAELEAANEYERMALCATNPKVKAVLESVAAEEKVHFHEFKAFLDTLDKEMDESEEQAEAETEEM